VWKSTLLPALGQVFTELRSQKLRFALNVAAFVIGGTCLIVLAGLVESTRQLVVAETQAATNSTAVRVRPSDPPPGQQRRTQRRLELGDAQTVAGSPFLTKGGVSSIREAWADITIHKQSRYVRVTGAGAGMPRAHRLEMTEGRFFGELELQSAARVAVVGAQLGQELRDGARDGGPLRLRIGSRLFTVIGILAKKPDLSGEGPWAWDERVIIPWTAFRASFQNTGRDRTVSEITWQGDFGPELNAADLMARARSAIQALVKTRHFGVDNFKLDDPAGEAQAKLIGWIVAGLLLSTAVISFVVGGFTITNASLASVSERRREIGIKRAIGASRADITLQFMLETALGASLGGLASVACGIFFTWVASAIVSLSVEEWQLVIPRWSLLAAALLAGVVGAAAGIYPARRAAALDPVQALRAD
jgi:putative ABC transport system permease protein